VSQLAIRCERLRKTYADVVAVDSLDLEVRVGECFGLLGPNGAGKTTSIEIMEGLTEPTSGLVEILGRRWIDGDEVALRERLGVTLQETRLPELLTVREILDLFRSFFAQPRATQALLELVGLQEKAEARQHTLSGGQKQRLAVACGLAGTPELLFLDEPTTGLDPQSRRQLWDVVAGLRKEGRTVLLTTHYMDEAERLCDRLAVVDRGRVIALGSPQQLIAEHIGGEVIDLELGTGVDGEAALRPLVGQGARDLVSRGSLVELVVDGLAEVMPRVLELLRAAELPIVRLSTRRPNLEDVFVKLTGRALRE
jgi:ABC-2 type transport system ATP-binding protein